MDTVFIPDGMGAVYVSETGSRSEIVAPAVYVTETVTTAPVQTQYQNVLMFGSGL